MTNLEEINEAGEQFERSLGKFMIAWRDAEGELLRVLIAYSKVSTGVARALFSGTRAKGMIDFIRNIAHNMEMPQDRMDDLEHVFTQMNVINSMRDHIVHHVTDSFSFDDPKSRIVANQRTTKIGTAVGYEIGTTDLDAMTYDLYGIANHLNMHWGQRSGPFRAWSENGDGVLTPWTYKQLQPIPLWEATPPKAPKRLNQRQPSPKK